MSDTNSTHDAFEARFLELEGRLLALRGVTGTLAHLAGETHRADQEEEDRHSLFCFLREEINRAWEGLHQLESAHHEAVHPRGGMKAVQKAEAAA